MGGRKASPISIWVFILCQEVISVSGVLAVIWSIYLYVKKKPNPKHSSLAQSLLFGSKISNLSRAWWEQLLFSAVLTLRHVVRRILLPFCLSGVEADCWLGPHLSVLWCDSGLSMWLFSFLTALWPVSAWTSPETHTETAYVQPFMSLCCGHRLTESEKSIDPTLSC